MMTCQELASRIEHLQPGAQPRDVARLCLLLTNSVDDADELASEERLYEAWVRAGLRLQAVTDQHAAMTEELEDLAKTDGETLSNDDFLTLFRAIKVQSRVIDLYVGQSIPT
ncbi:MAG: hypothetical protein JNL96_00705 [Planctomycetaceae bacterium]|nr:hypothetical protein [Planctomycetaceae bacterium]